MRWTFSPARSSVTLGASCRLIGPRLTSPTHNSTADRESHDVTMLF